MDTCEFSYISRADSMPKRVLGIEQSWEELKRDMGRTGPGCPGGVYFKTISVQGPQLFAVVNNNFVYYHENDRWYRYITACDIKFGMMECNNNNITRATDDRTKIDQAMGDTDWVIVPRET